MHDKCEMSLEKRLSETLLKLQALILLFTLIQTRLAPGNTFNSIFVASSEKHL